MKKEKANQTGEEQISPPRPNTVPLDAFWSEVDKEWVQGMKDEQGQLQGMVRYFRSDGTLLSECGYINGKPHGESKRFHESGELSQHCHYQYGVFHGLCTFYATTQSTTEVFYTPSMSRSIVKAEVDYENGMRLAYRYFNELGTRLHSDGSLYQDPPPGVPKNAYFDPPSEEWVSGIWNEQNQRVGVSKRWRKDGSLAAKQNFIEGVLDGTCTFYYQGGSVQIEYTYQKGILHGQSQIFRPDGTLARTAHFQENRFEGPLEDFDPQGTLLRRVVFHGDQRIVEVDRIAQQTQTKVQSALFESVHVENLDFGTSNAFSQNGFAPLGEELKHRKRLFLKNQSLQVLPSEISEMSSLEVLILSHNHLTDIPDWLFELPNLHYVDISHNPLLYPEKVLAQFAASQKIVAVRMENTGLRRLSWSPDAQSALTDSYSGFHHAQELCKKKLAIPIEKKFVFLDVRKNPIEWLNPFLVYQLPTMFAFDGISTESPRGVDILRFVETLEKRSQGFDPLEKVIQFALFLGQREDALQIGGEQAITHALESPYEQVQVQARLIRKIPSSLEPALAPETEEMLLQQFLSLEKNIHHKAWLVLQKHQISPQGMALLCAEGFWPTQTPPVEDKDTWWKEMIDEPETKVISRSRDCRILFQKAASHQLLATIIGLQLHRLPRVPAKKTWLILTALQKHREIHFDLLQAEVKERSFDNPEVLFQFGPASVKTYFEKNIHQFRLNLGHENLTALPSDISFFPTIQDLELSYNHLTSLPGEIGDIFNLRRLTMNNNRVQSLPQELQLLPLLQSLHIAENEMTHVPKVIFDCSSLETLNLSHNQLSTLPSDIGRLTQLKTMWINDNPLQTFPDELSRLQNLKFLHLGNLPFEQIPDPVFAIEGLEELWVNSSCFRYLSPKIAQFKKLRLLVMWYSKLETIPKELFEMKQLKELRISHNPLPASVIPALKEALPHCTIY